MSEHDTQIDSLLRAPYARQVIPEPESGTFTGRILEFPGCIAQGDSVEETYESLEEAARDWLIAAIDLGQEIPEPAETQEYRGRVLVRFPKSLHRRAVEAAQRDATSLNQFIVSAVAEKVGASSATAALRESMREFVKHTILESSWLDFRTYVTTAAHEEQRLVFLDEKVLTLRPQTVFTSWEAGPMIDETELVATQAGNVLGMTHTKSENG